VFLSFGVDTSELHFKTLDIHNRNPTISPHGSILIGRFSRIQLLEALNGIVLYIAVPVTTENGESWHNLPFWIVRFTSTQEAKDWCDMLKLAWELVAPAQQLILAASASKHRQRNAEHKPSSTEIDGLTERNITRGVRNVEARGSVDSFEMTSDIKRSIA